MAIISASKNPQVSINPTLITLALWALPPPTSFRVLGRIAIFGLRLKGMSSSTTNFGPLTTTFTPPSDCSSLRLFEHVDGTDGFYGAWGESCRPGEEGGLGIIQARTCYPEKLGSYYIASGHPAWSTLPVFSPGTACPAGWTTACSVVRSQGDKAPAKTSTTTASWAMWNLAEDGQTALACCPK